MQSEMTEAKTDVDSLRGQLKQSKEELAKVRETSSCVIAAAEAAAAAARSELKLAQQQLHAQSSAQATMSSMMETISQMLLQSGNEAQAARLSAQAAKEAAAAAAWGAGGRDGADAGSDSVMRALADGVGALQGAQQQRQSELTATKVQVQGLRRAVDRAAPASKPARAAAAVSAQASIPVGSVRWTPKVQLLCESATSDAVVTSGPSPETLLVTNAVTGVQIHPGWLLTGASAPLSDATRIPGASRADWTPVMTKLFEEAGIGDSLLKHLAAEILSMQQLGKCPRVVSMYGESSPVVCEGKRHHALVMEAGGTVMVSPCWALEHALDAGVVSDAATAVRQALALDPSSGFSAALRELGKPEACGSMSLCLEAGTTVGSVLGDAAGLSAGLGRTFTVSRSLNNLRSDVYAMARSLRTSSRLSEAVHSFVDAVAVSAWPAGVDDADDLGNSDVHAILSWHLLPLRRRLELCLEMALGLAEVHLGDCLPGGYDKWTPAEAKNWWNARASSSGAASGASVAAAAAAASASSLGPAPSAARGGGFVHRDVKPENYFVFPGFKVKVGDLGEVKRQAEFTRVTNASKGRAVPRGTVEYMSPEMWEARTPAMGEPAVDVYSLGMSMVPLVALGEPTPWSRRLVPVSASSGAQAERDEALKALVIAGERPSWEDDLTAWERGEGVAYLEGHAGLVRSWWGIMEQCWQADPAARPSALEVGCAISQLLKSW
jgi:hypothetical protein